MANETQDKIILEHGFSYSSHKGKRCLFIQSLNSILRSYRKLQLPSCKTGESKPTYLRMAEERDSKTTIQDHPTSIKEFLIGDIINFPCCLRYF